MRIILYTGKGGVGKTSIAACTAIRCAARGYRTIILSTDAAHSLGDSLEASLGPEPLQVAENLWAQEIDTLHQIERSWGKVQGYLAAVLRSQNVAEIYTEELTVFPGMEELFSLLEILRHCREGKYDVIVVDCAPTGETLRMLGYPDVMRWWLERIFPIQRKVVKVVRPVARPVLGIQLPSDEVLNAVSDLFKELEELHDLLVDAESSSVRLVVNPEKMVINEARRSFTYLNLFGLHTDAVVVNRIFPPTVRDEYFQVWKEVQGKHYTTIEESFSPLPIFKVPLFEQEVVGTKSLVKMADSCFGDVDPAKIFYSGLSQTIKKDGEGYVLELKLPFAAKGDISLSQKVDDLYIKVGNYRRNVSLPRAIAGREVAGARYEDDILKIRFGGDKDVR